MPILDWLAGGLPVVQNLFNARQNKIQNKWNKQAVDLQWNRDRQAWNEENEYNSPKSQMQRYQDAGLNPMLIYGSGSASAGNATSYYKSGQYDQNAYKLDLPMMVGMANSLKDYKLKDTQNDVMKADINLKDAQIEKTKNDSDLSYAKGLSESFKRILIGAQGGGVLLDNRLKAGMLDDQLQFLKIKMNNAILDASLKNQDLVNKKLSNQLGTAELFKRNTMNKYLDDQQWNLREIQKKQMKNYNVRNDLLDYQLDLGNRFKQQGVTMKDPYLWRLYSRFINTLEF